jgi:2-dehydropantoate 2-reductase
MQQPIYILGSGAIGFPLAAALTEAGRKVVAVRTSRNDIPGGTIPITVQDGDRSSTTAVETISLVNLERIEGLIVIASKSHANGAIAEALQTKSVKGAIVLLQNGIGVEQPFLAAGFAPIYRCILYISGQTLGEYHFAARAVLPSPIGIVQGDEAGLQHCVNALSTERSPFRLEANIQREIWKKTIINTTFNSLCPLLDADNGIFAHNAEAARLAREVVDECVALAERLGLDLGAEELIEQILFLSKQSAGRLTSTLQDLRYGRPTEIEYFNLALARIAAALEPPLPMPRVALLGHMVALRAGIGDKIDKAGRE